MTLADAPAVVKAKLVPLDGASPDLGNAIEVQFNPSSLKVALENEIKADAKAKGKRGTAAQHIEKSSSTLSVELIFDTSIPATEGAVEDVRKKTGAIADRFMKSDEQKKAPTRVRFQWGSFQFDGIVASYAETLEFFSPEGIPLRSLVSLSIKEDAYQFAFATPDKAPAPRQPPAIVGGPEEPVHSSVQRAKKDPRDWRDTALANGVENPRLPGAGGGLGIGLGGGIGVSGGLGASAGVGLSGGIGVPAGASIDAGAAVGGSFSVGASASLGTHIPGAFADLPARPGVSASAGASIGVSAGASAGASASVGVGASGGASFGAGAGASFGVEI